MSNVGRCRQTAICKPVQSRAGALNLLRQAALEGSERSTTKLRVPVRELKAALTQVTAGTAGDAEGKWGFASVLALACQQFQCVGTIRRFDPVAISPSQACRNACALALEQYSDTSIRSCHANPKGLSFQNRRPVSRRHGRAPRKPVPRQRPKRRSCRILWDAFGASWGLGEPADAAPSAQTRPRPRKGSSTR